MLLFIVAVMFGDENYNTWMQSAQRMYIECSLCRAIYRDEAIGHVHVSCKVVVGLLPDGIANFITLVLVATITNLQVLLILPSPTTSPTPILPTLVLSL